MKKLIVVGVVGGLMLAWLARSLKPIYTVMASRQQRFAGTIAPIVPDPRIDPLPMFEN